MAGCEPEAVKELRPLRIHGTTLVTFAVGLSENKIRERHEKPVGSFRAFRH